MVSPDPSRALYRWAVLIDNLQASPLEFYALIEQAIAKRQVPGVRTEHVEWREGGIFSAKRIYLRVWRQDVLFDICGAPFGTGFFVSSWSWVQWSGLWGFLFSIPILGPFCERLFKPLTYYRVDTALMFQTSIHGAVMDVIDGLTKANGLRVLTELERKPMLRDLFR